MKLRLRNINKIREASIQIKGLTVIAGENDSGKSTVGKVLFSMIKAISRQGEDLEEGKEKEIFKIIESLFFKLRNYVTHIDKMSPVKRDKEFRELFMPPTFFDELKVFISLSGLLTDTTRQQLSEIISYRRQFIEKLPIPPPVKIEFIINLDRVKTLCSEVQSDPLLVFNKAIAKALYSEFYSNVCSHNTDKSLIELSTGGHSIEVGLADNKIYRTYIGDLFIQPYDDVTFIETPMYLQLTHLLETAQTLFDSDDGEDRFKPRIPLHIKDLVKKIGLSRYATEVNDELSEFINSIIKGRFIFDKKSNQYLFIKDGCGALQPSNVASGIKNFGIIQLLLQVEELNDRKMLIIDEPENHLHPQWQLLFALLIVKLAKYNITILLSSHSPYFIQAIKYYSMQEDIHSMVNYYLVESDEEYVDMTRVENVTNNMDRIFVKLAEPLNQILGV